MVDHFVHDHGKGNYIGRVVYKAFATHVNPRLDASAHFGLNLMLRFCVLGEPFPNFEDPDDYTKRPIYRAPNNYGEVLSPITMYRNWKAFFDYNEVICTKITHQPRVDLQQRISNMGVDGAVLERFIGYVPEGGAKKMNSAQLNSYLMCPPVQAIAAAADGDPHNPRNHNPGWDVDIPLGPEGCLKLLIPSLYEQMSVIQIAFDECKTHKERAENQLCQSLGGLKAIEWRIFHGVLLLASLPLDSNNILMTDQPPIITRWASFSVTKLPFFSSVEFHNILNKVHASQKSHAQLLHLELSSQNKNIIQMEIGERILPGILAQSRLCMGILESQRRSEAELKDIKAMIRNCFDSGANGDNQNRVGSLYSPTSKANSNCPPPSLLDMTPTPVSHNPELCKDGLPRERKPHRRLAGGPFSKQNISALDFWNEYYGGVNGKEALRDMEIRDGSSWRSDTTCQKGTTALKATWCLQKPLYDFMAYLTAEGYAPEAAVQTIQLIFNQQAYKTGKPDLGLCNKVFKRIMKHEVPVDFVGERRQPRKSQKRKGKV